MNQTEKIFEIGDYKKNTLNRKQSVRDRYLVVTDTDGKTVAIRLPSIEKTESNIPAAEEQNIIRTCGMCVFFHNDKYSTNSFCSIRKIMNPSNPGFYFKNPKEKGCRQFTLLQENKDSSM